MYQLGLQGRKEREGGMEIASEEGVSSEHLFSESFTLVNGCR